jgi:hypothetical protein
MSRKKDPTPPSSGGSANKPINSSVQSCPLKDKARIVSIAYLDGTDDKEIAGGKHYVNFPRNVKWVNNSEIKNIDRLSHTPRIKVRFNKPGAHGFKVKYLPNGDNVVYSDAEKARNSHFKYQDQQKSYTTDGDGTKILPVPDFFVAAAGKDKYKLEAEDDQGNTVKSGNLEIYRLFYCIEIKMRSLTTVASNINTLKNEYKKHHISILELGSVIIDHMPNIGSQADTNAFKSTARGAYTSSDATEKEPYVIAIAYTDHLAVKNANQQLRKANVTVGPNQPKVSIPVMGTGLRTGDSNFRSKALWQNIVPGEDWFVSAQFLKNGGTVGADEVTILKDKCTPIARGSNAQYCTQVDIDVTGLPTETGTLTITVNWVDRMRAGLASSGNMVIICTRAWWNDKSTRAQNEVMIHEIGHMLGMVTNGSGTLPDTPAKHYANRGHVGNHCHSGLALRDSFASGDNSGSNCVMFGATNGKSAFCGDCTPAVRKLDICNGWTRF